MNSLMIYHIIIVASRHQQRLQRSPVIASSDRQQPRGQSLVFCLFNFTKFSPLLSFHVISCHFLSFHCHFIVISYEIIKVFNRILSILVFSQLFLVILVSDPFSEEQFYRKDVIYGLLFSSFVLSCRVLSSLFFCSFL